MTPEAQRIALAELAGYERCDPNPCLKSQLLGFKNKAWKCVPDYLHDLNAIHELETALSERDQARYQDMLAFMFVGPQENYPLFLVISATAAQRAEALLRTLDKWKEDE